MTATGPISLTVSPADERFARFERVEWWDQRRLRDAKVLVAGAGAIGNEVIKNLALLGIGHLVIADMDTIEVSNLSAPHSSARPTPGCQRPSARRRGSRALSGYRCRGIAAHLRPTLSSRIFQWGADVVVGHSTNREATPFPQLCMGARETARFTVPLPMNSTIVLPAFVLTPVNPCAATNSPPLQRPHPLVRTARHTHRRQPLIKSPSLHHLSRISLSRPTVCTALRRQAK